MLHIFQYINIVKIVLTEARKLSQHRVEFLVRVFGIATYSLVLQSAV